MTDYEDHDEQPIQASPPLHTQGVAGDAESHELSYDAAALASSIKKSIEARNKRAEELKADLERARTDLEDSRRSYQSGFAGSEDRCVRDSAAYQDVLNRLDENAAASRKLNLISKGLPAKGRIGISVRDTLDLSELLYHLPPRIRKPLPPKKEAKPVRVEVSNDDL